MLADWCPKPSVLVCQRYLDLMLDLSKPGFQIHSGVSKPGALVYRRCMVKIWTRGFVRCCSGQAPTSESGAVRLGC